MRKAGLDCSQQSKDKIGLEGKCWFASPFILNLSMVIKMGGPETNHGCLWSLMNDQKICNYTVCHVDL